MVNRKYPLNPKGVSNGKIKNIKRCNIQKINSKMADLNLTLSLVTLNVTGLNTLIKKKRD